MMKCACNLAAALLDGEEPPKDAIARFAQKRNRTYRWYFYDVWGNAEDGYEINQTIRSVETYEIPISIRSEAQVIACLKAQNFFKGDVQFDQLEIEFSEDDIILTYKGCPEGELSPETN